jgi:hypothetical protein
MAGQVPYVFMGTDGMGHNIAVKLTATADTMPDGVTPLYALAVNSAVTIDPGNITIASVTMKDGVAATLAAVKTGSTLVASDKAIAVHDANPTSAYGLGIDPSLPAALGVTGARFHSADASGAAAAITDAPTAGKRLVITDLLISVQTNMVLTFTEQTSGTILAVLDLLAHVPFQFSPRGKMRLATADKTLMVRASVSGVVDITPLWYSEA